MSLPGWTIKTTPKNPINIADHLYIPTLSFKKIIDKITMKNGDENVRTIAVANLRLITEINMKIFIDKKASPLKKLKIINLLFKFLKIEKYSFVNRIRTKRGITPAIFLKTASWITEYSSPKNLITTIYMSTHRIAKSIVTIAKYVFFKSVFSDKIFIYNLLKLYTL